MRSEKDKMLAGELYDPADPQLVAERVGARRLLAAFNHGPIDQRPEVLRRLLPHAGTNLVIEPPFFCDYGTHIEAGDNVFFNFNCVVLDVAAVVIGSRVMVGPAVQIYAATHPLGAAERASGLELGRPVRIGDDVWIGGGSVVCPGVTIGARTVVGAGSVVTRDLPPDVVAVGNPCRVVRPRRE